MKANVVSKVVQRSLSLVSFFVLVVASPLIAEEGHDFYGRHFIAQYYDCNNKALTDVNKLKEAMTEATKLSGAHVLTNCDHVFEGNGYSLVFLLSESHASIHTYPEYNACFIDLFTCGQKCSPEKFDEAMRAYLHPKSVTRSTQERR